jgi:subtilisin family serine protease/subtilisin-like proprotein convertase family protein
MNKKRKHTTPSLTLTFVLALLGVMLLLGAGSYFGLKLAAAATRESQDRVAGQPPEQERKSARVETPSQDPQSDQFSRMLAPAGGDLMDKARAAGAVRVIVGLRTPFRPEGELLGSFAVQAQRAAIARAQQTLLDRLNGYTAASVKRFASIPYLALEVDAEGLRQLQGDPAVETIREDELYRPALEQSVALVGGATAHAAGFSGRGQNVVVIDTGSDKTHPSLSGKVVSEACYSTTGANSTSVCPGGVPSSTAPGSGVNCDPSIAGCDHGTHVAGIAAGRAATGSGVAPDANIISIQVFSRFSGSSVCGSSSPCAIAYRSDVLKGLERVQELSGSHNIAAVNLSLGGRKYASASACDAGERDYKAVIDNLRSRGIATVVAAGNAGYTGAEGAPACISSAISVGSTADGSEGTTADEVSAFSNSAHFLSLFAPGERIRSSVPGGLATFSGTSMAAPHVVGAVALLKQKSPQATVSQVLQALAATGKPIADPRNGVTKPRIRVDLAAQAISASPCNYALSTNSQSVPDRGGAGAVEVTAGAGCARTAESNVPWVRLRPDPNGEGPGTVNFVVEANAGPEREGTITIAGQLFTIKQAGVAGQAVDDGSFENGIGLARGGTLCAVNRLTPATYPATINAVAIFFQSGGGGGRGSDATLRIGTNPGGGSSIDGATYREQAVKVQTPDRFSVYPIAPLTIQSGDFLIGFSMTHRAGIAPVAMDQSERLNRRSYISANCSSFTIVDDISSTLAGNFGIRGLLAPQLLARGAATLTAEEGCAVNQTIDPGEKVTVEFGLQNLGAESTANLTATLEPGGGLSDPGGPQTYGALAAGGPAVARAFTFTIGPACGATLEAKLRLRDGETEVGTVTFEMPVGGRKSYRYTGATVPIPDPGTIEVPITITDAGAASDIKVHLRLQHDWAADMDISLVGPDGTTVELSTDNGGIGVNYGSGSNDCSGAAAIFDDSAPAPIASAVAPFVGRFRPEGRLAAFNGKPLAGTWKLRITDDDRVLSGVFGCWRIESAECCANQPPANRPPLAKAKSLPASTPATSDAGADVVLDGSESSDPDGDALSFSWRDQGREIATTATATVKLAAGAHSITLTVRDGRGGEATTEAQSITIAPRSGLRVTFIDPDSGSRGDHVRVSVIGSGFTNRSQIKLSGFDVTVSTTPVSDIKLMGTVRIPKGAATGRRDVIVTDPGGGMAVLADAFTVKP